MKAGKWNIGIALLSTMVILCSCDSERYEIVQSNSGTLIRLDRKTGEVAIISGNKLVLAKTPDETAAEEADAQKRAGALESPRVWPIVEVKQIGVTSADLTTAWRSGRMLYRFQVTPVPKGYERMSSLVAPFTLKFYDMGGFELLSVDLNYSDLTGVADSTGERVGLSANSSTDCSQSSYESVAYWNLSWRI